MSYFPKRDKARIALKALTKPSTDYFDYFPKYRVQALREVLIGMVCPCVCVGVVNDTGWHRLCEQKADAALVALGFKAEADVDQM